MKRIALFLSVFLLAFAAGAQEFPTRPVTIIVPFSAGGPTDTIARIMAQRMTKALGQNVLVENTTGAGGTIGVGRVARAAPDGYTLGIGHIGTHVVNGAIYELPYDLQKDFEPVAMIASNPQIIVSKLAVPARDLKELIAWVKANQDKVSLATGGAGTPAHVSATYFQQVTGLVQVGNQIVQKGTNGFARLTREQKSTKTASFELAFAKTDLLFSRLHQRPPATRLSRCFRASKCSCPARVPGACEIALSF